jgi:hypothetical protein
MADAIAGAGMIEVGRVVKYFRGPGVVALELYAPVSVGDVLVIRSKGGKLRGTGEPQQVVSMQVNHSDIAEAAAGAIVGIKFGLGRFKDEETPDTSSIPRKGDVALIIAKSKPSPGF